MTPALPTPFRPMIRWFRFNRDVSLTQRVTRSIPITERDLKCHKLRSSNYLRRRVKHGLRSDQVGPEGKLKNESSRALYLTMNAPFVFTLHLATEIIKGLTNCWSFSMASITPAQ